MYAQSRLAMDAMRFAEVMNTLAPATPIEIWFHDEMRVGQKNGLVYQWAKKGTRPRQPKDQRLRKLSFRRGLSGPQYRNCSHHAACRHLSQQPPRLILIRVLRLPGQTAKICRRKIIPKTNRCAHLLLPESNREAQMNHNPPKTTRVSPTQFGITPHSHPFRLEFGDRPGENLVFKQPTVFVVGAGASKEYNFPLGSDLKNQIAEAVRFRFAHGVQLISGSADLLDHSRRDALFNGWAKAPGSWKKRFRSPVDQAASPLHQSLSAAEKDRVGKSFLAPFAAGACSALWTNPSRHER
jgi:hypothetical protein